MGKVAPRWPRALFVHFHTSDLILVEHVLIFRALILAFGPSGKPRFFLHIYAARQHLTAAEAGLTVGFLFA